MTLVRYASAAGAVRLAARKARVASGATETTWGVDEVRLGADPAAGDLAAATKVEGVGGDAQCGSLSASYVLKGAEVSGARRRRGRVIETLEP